MALLLELHDGKLPFFISPRQLRIIPVSSTCTEYALRVAREMNGYFVDVDETDNTLSKKIRNAWNDGVCFVGVVGEKEMNGDKIQTRQRGGDQKEMGIDEMKAVFDELMRAPLIN